MPLRVCASLRESDFHARTTDTSSVPPRRKSTDEAAGHWSSPCGTADGRPSPAAVGARRGGRAADGGRLAVRASRVTFGSAGRRQELGAVALWPVGCLMISIQCPPCLDSGDDAASPAHPRIPATRGDGGHPSGGVRGPGRSHRIAGGERRESSLASRAGRAPPGHRHGRAILDVRGGPVARTSDKQGVTAVMGVAPSLEAGARHEGGRVVGAGRQGSELN